MRLAKDLTECPFCGCEFVYHRERYQIGDSDWWKVVLVCPNCLRDRVRVVDHKTVRELLKQMRLGREAFARIEKMKIEKNMGESAYRFISALRKDWLLPSDFGDPTEEGVSRARIEFYNACCRYTGKEDEMMPEVWLTPFAEPEPDAVCICPHCGGAEPSIDWGLDLKNGMWIGGITCGVCLASYNEEQEHIPIRDYRRLEAWVRRLQALKELEYAVAEAATTIRTESDAGFRLYLQKRKGRNSDPSKT